MESFTALLERLHTLDQLLRTRQTGTPEQLSTKLGMSRSSWFKLKDWLEFQLQVPIVYDKQLQTYYYSTPGHIFIGFQRKYSEKKQSLI
jgi:hypothetical protein